MAFLLPSASASASSRRNLFSAIRISSSTSGAIGSTCTFRTGFAISSGYRLGLATQRSYLNTMAREKILIVGTGWAGYTFSRALDDKIFDIQIVSPETAFPYTPLLVRFPLHDHRMAAILSTERYRWSNHMLIEITYRPQQHAASSTSPSRRNPCEVIPGT